VISAHQLEERAAKMRARMAKVRAGKAAVAVKRKREPGYRREEGTFELRDGHLHWTGFSGCNFCKRAATVEALVAKARTRLRMHLTELDVFGCPESHDSEGSMLRGRR
jgi:hypothetical protein